MAGHVCLWRYRERTPAHPGLHLSADITGCDQLLVLLGSLAKTRAPRIANITLDPVTPAILAVASNRDAAVTAYQHWEIVVDPRFAPEHFRFVVTNGRARTELSAVQVESLAAGITDIRQGRGGYSIGDEDDQLWFWWRSHD